MRQHIHKIELIGKGPIDRDISIYLFAVRSVTAKLRNDIARRFRERPEIKRPTMRFSAAMRRSEPGPG